MRSWYDLETKEKEKLEEEFEEKSSMKKRKNYDTFVQFGGGLIVLIGLILLIYSTNTRIFILGIVEIICGSMAILTTLVNPYNKKYDETFTKWLEVSKKIIK